MGVLVSNREMHRGMQRAARFRDSSIARKVNRWRP